MFGLNSTPADTSRVAEVLRAERERQWRDIILIPSESICHPESAGILSSEFSNVYAEGQADVPLLPDPTVTALDSERFRSWHTRLADGRFYRGCGQADVVELLARRYIAELFAQLPGSPDVDSIRVNVQALSGAPANTAVFQALLEHGDAVMGLDLACGGHLTHGSEFNYSGKSYRVASYSIDPDSRVLDYDKVRELAHDHRPRLIIGGASAYPWDFDWTALRAIADEVDAYLLADISHLAGLVAGGVLANPLPHAHVVSYTTHKTLCGPRGAVIMTCEPDVAKMINAGVFPGLQGGPHLHTISALARHFEIILENRAEFVDMQQAVIDNTALLAKGLTEEGFALEYGGTNTHMLLVDLKKFGEGGLDGETASRFLELAGLVCNKNMLPGDRNGAVASGIRMGMTWPTQRGVTPEQVREIAAITKFVLERVKTFKVWTPSGEERGRGRAAAGVVKEARGRTDRIVEALPWPARPDDAAEAAELRAPVVEGRSALLLRGDKVSLCLDQLMTCKVAGTDPCGSAEGLMLREDGSVLDRVAAVRLPDAGREERYALLVAPGSEAEVVTWIRDLSDGYLHFSEDLYAKIDGPTIVEPLPEELAADSAVVEAARSCGAAPEGRITAQIAGDSSVCSITKPYFIGQQKAYALAAPPPKEDYEYAAPELPLRKTVLNERHRELGGKMVPFAGWEMPVQYADGIFAEHRAVRSAAGLFDVSHMSQFEVAGRDALQFLDTVLANCVSRLEPGYAQYTYFLYPDGTAIDDLYLYCISRERYIIVANAANAERDFDWLQAAASGKYVLDSRMPGKDLTCRVTIRDLRDAGADSLAAMALQGPLARKVLSLLVEADEGRSMIAMMDRNAFARISLGGIEAVVARTGYTGEAVGYEISTHPDGFGDLWDKILDAGAPLGVRAAGLGARDSTRTEAGLPLFGHEIEGTEELTLTDAGYGFVVRFHVPFFIGREAYLERTRTSPKRVIRLAGRGRKSVRPGHVILDEKGEAVGTVTSFAYVDEEFGFYALAAVAPRFNPEPDEVVRAARVAANRLKLPVKEDRIVELKALMRFPDNDERSSWRERYVRE